MAAPNIVGISTLVGIATYYQNIPTSSTTILSNAASSNKVFRVISLVASNKTSSVVNVTVFYQTAAAGAGTSISILSSSSVPANTSLIVVGRDVPLYLEENRSLNVLSSSSSAIDIIASYETIG